MKHDLAAALDQCLAWMRHGASIESCLDRYPEFAAELGPLLAVAVNVASARVPAPAAPARVSGRQRLLDALARKQESQAREQPVARLIKRLFVTLVPDRPAIPALAWKLATVVAAVVLLAGGWMAVAATADSLPGDALYPVKLAAQRAELALTLDPDKHRLTADRFEAQRRLDVQAALSGRRQVAVEFRGVLQHRDGAYWIVDGLPVEVRATTVIAGQPDLGAIVQVWAELPGNGDMTATRLVVEPMTVQDETETDMLGPTPTPSPGREHPATSAPKPALEHAATLEPTGSPTPAEHHAPAETEEPGGMRGHEETPDTAATPGVDDVGEPERAKDPTDPPASAETREDEDAAESSGPPESDDTVEPDAQLEATESPEPDDTDDEDEAEEPEGTPEHEGTTHGQETPDASEEPEGGDAPEHDDTPEGDDEPESTDDPDDEAG
jgi:hypothetical protein